MSISKEDFDVWRGNPVTEEVFRAFEKLAEKAKRQWIETSWGRGICDPVLRADLHARAEVIDDFRELTFEDLEAWLDEQPKRDIPNRIQGADKAEEG